MAGDRLPQLDVVARRAGDICTVGNAAMPQDALIYRPPSATLMWGRRNRCKGIAMAFSAIIRRARRSAARRNAYHRLLREIETFSDRELSDMGTAREAIRREAWRSVYG